MRPTRILAVAGLLTLAACGSGGGAEQPAPPPPEVTVATVSTQPIANIVELPGRIQAIRIAEVRARVNGIVERRVFDEGSDVRAGAVLFRIDPRELNATQAAARSTLIRNQATAENARAVVRRFQPLLNEGAVSRQEYDAAVATLRTAEADIAQARANLQTAQINLGYSTVRAPISGRVGRAEVTEGALVTATEGTLLTRVEQIDRVYVNFGQSSGDLLRLRQDVAAGRVATPAGGRFAVNLVLEDGSDYGFSGFIDFLDLSIDPATGTAALRAEFPNPQRILLPGGFVRARIQAGTRPDGILVPQRAVRLAADAATVMVVAQNNTVEARPVQLGSLQGANWQIREGLRPGERVVVDGGQMLRPGQPVRIAAPGRPGQRGPAPAAAPGRPPAGTQAPGANAPGGTAPQPAQQSQPAN